MYIYIYIFNFGRGFCGSFSILFPEAPVSCDKEILKQFLTHCPSICMSSKSTSQTFKILILTGDSNNFVLLGVFLAYMFN